MNRPPPQPQPARIPPPAPKKLPPIRMGDRSDALRQQKARTAEKHQIAARIRARIYQDILALLDIAERLTVDLSARQDRYGLEWQSLARQIYAHYNADVVKIVPEFQAKIMSKEGAQGLPKGLYRHLLDFGEECAEFLRWARLAMDGKLPANGRENEFLDACFRFRKACADIRQQICIFENERPPTEESFFG